MDQIDNRARLVLVGGFLGSGKTTMILSLAKHLLAKGDKVGIVTNDQGSKLVDTEYLAAQGLPVYDVKGGCFCSKFDELEDRINELEDTEKPDVILCEPIGSGIDLISTLLKPMNEGAIGNYRLSPYCTLVDPIRAKRYFEHKDTGRPTAIDFLFEQQLKEADLIYLNKCDTLSQAEIKDLVDRLKTFDNAEVMHGSVIEGYNVDMLYTYLLGHRWQERDALQLKCVDKNKALSQLSWLNATYKVAGRSLDSYGESLLENIQGCLKDVGQIAHVKAFVTSGMNECKVSIVSNEDKPVTAGSLSGSLIQVLLNARVQIEPKGLEKVVDQAVARTNSRYGARMLSYDSDCFAPNQGSCSL